MEAQLLQELSAALRDHAAAMREHIAAIKRETSEWVTADEACELLGFKLTPSGHHQRRLIPLRDRGLLRTFGSTHPYTYSRKEVMQLAEAKLKGKMHF